jgi:hypothetical protein
MKDLSLTDKDTLRKKLEGYIKNFQLLLLPFTLVVVLAYFAFRNHWVAAAFPPYLVLLGLVFLFTLVTFGIEITRIRKAINCTSKAIFAGKITSKIRNCGEYNSDCFFVIRGKKLEVECDQFDAFKEGDYVRFEYSSSGNELICVKPIKQNLLLHRAYRKAKISAKKLRRK